MKLLDGVIEFINETMDASGDTETITAILGKYGMNIVLRSPEDRARILAFIGLITMDLALCAEEEDGSYSSATLTARSIVKATEEVLYKLGMQHDFLGTCSQAIHMPRVVSRLPKEEDYKDVVWN